LLLPVNPGERYTLELSLRVPAQALSPDAGIYCAGKLLEPLKDALVFKVELPAASEDVLEVELRCKGWVPQKVIPGSQDPRVLGVQLFKLTMRSRNGPAEPFPVNSGK
jgi:hypothetical protein